MIRINLLGEKVDRTVEFVVQTLIFAAGIVVTLVGCIFTYSSYSTEVSRLTNERAELQGRLQKLEKVTKQIDDLEKNKKLLKEKLQTIATLKAKKHGPVHILDDINRALPERAWLLYVKEKSGMLEVQGIALDNQTIANFMENLQKYPFFSSVDLVLSTEYLKDEIKLKQFTLSVLLKSALQAQSDAKAAGENNSAPAAKQQEKKTTT